MSDDIHKAAAGPRSKGARCVIFAAASLVTLGSIGFALQFYRNVLGLLLYNEQFLAGMLALGIALIYLTQPVRRGMSRPDVPWYDWLLAALSFAVGVYIAVRYPALSEDMTARPIDGLIVAFITIPLVLEALRRSVGLALTIIVLVFLVYAPLGQYIPGPLAGLPVSVAQLAFYQVWDPGSMLGLPLMVGATVVIAFVFFGNLLFASGGSAFFTDIALTLMGRYRGGSAKIAVTASCLFGMISGSAVSNVASVGVLTIPLMRRGGYPAHVAAAIESVASTGGQLMPPVMGAAAFLMAEFLQIPYRDVAVAAALPALLYYYALFIQADLLAARTGLTSVKQDVPPLGQVLRQGWHFLLPFGLLVYALFWLNWSPELSALAASAVLVVTGPTLGYGSKKLGLGEFIDAFRSTGIASLDLLIITAAAGFIIGVLNITGLSFALTLLLVEIGSGNLWLLLVLAAIVSIILGMGMPTVGVYVLLATLVAPAMVKIGMSPMASHMFVMYFGMMSMITPPVALAAYAAASLAHTDPMKTGWTAVRFGWIAFVIPFLFVRAPSLLLEGSLASIVMATITAVLGVWLICAGFAGYAVRPLSMPMRIGFGIAGLLLFIPADAVPHGEWTDIVGLIFGAILLAREVVASRTKRLAATSPKI
ncbi:MAG TPA: TRAP transporter fused permease subunit [Pseudolabrys sp.]|nr:TRAP transporter fused permease subunit [Pseudolabrys sp.]